MMMNNSWRNGRSEKEKLAALSLLLNGRTKWVDLVCGPWRRCLYAARKNQRWNDV